MGPAPRNILEAILPWGGEGGETRHEGRTLHFWLPASIQGVFRGRLFGDLGLSPAAVTGTGATWGPACWAVLEARSRQREESSGSSSIVVATLLAQERLTVFCVYWISVLFKRMALCFPGVSFWNVCVQQSISLHPLPCDGRPGSPTPALT